MSERGGGLRLRLSLGVLAAGLLALTLACIAVLLLVRDELYARRMSDARERLRAASAGLEAGCGAAGGETSLEVAPGDGPAALPAPRPCLERGLVQLAGEGVRALPAGSCAKPLAREPGRAMICQEAPAAGRSLVLAVELEPVREQLRALDARIFGVLLLALFSLVLFAAWVLERVVVRRLSPIDAALGRVGASPDDGEPSLLSEGGDALGRIGAAVNRLAGRLARERRLTREQIVSLQTANRRLADEQRALREAREDLARSERLATVGRLAAGVAHEVGNPLAAIIGYAAILRTRLAEGRDGSEYADRIEREAGRMDRILRDLLDLARPRTDAQAPLDLKLVAAQAHALVSPQPLWSGCTLSVELPETLPRALGVEHYAVQVLVNLFLNAAKAKARRVRVGGAAENGFVRLDVEDDGVGIPAEHLGRLFEPFFSSAAPGEGTGLGLALCHASMERIGGSISAVPRPAGQGAHFALRFRSAPGTA